MKKRRHKSQAPIEGDLRDGRFYCRRISWWEKYSDEELATMQRRGKQLREGGYGAIKWDDLIGRR